MAKLSKAELAKREDLIMSMKKNKRNLVKKYGSDAEKVMYGRATNLAKKLAETDMEQNKLREMVKAALMKPMDEKKSFPDLTGDGKVTKADILKGRGVDIKEADGVSSTLSQALFKLEDEPKHMIDAYKKSLANDIRINGKERYADYSVDDFIEDYENYIQGRLDEDLDLGHQDNEPHMLKGDLYRIGKYAMELYQMVDEFEGMGEVDFPHWWQAKIINAREAIESAKHYLDFETKEPEIDATVDVIDMSGALDNIGVEEPVTEQADHVSPMVVKAYKEYLQAKKDGNGEKAYRYYSKKLNNTYSTRADRDAIEAILKKKYGSALEEGLPKDYWAKKIPGGKMDESYEALVKKLKGQGKSEKAAKAIAGAVASYKAKGGGKGPTAKQKAR